MYRKILTLAFLVLFTTFVLSESTFAKRSSGGSRSGSRSGSRGYSSPSRSTPSRSTPSSKYGSPSKSGTATTKPTNKYGSPTSKAQSYKPTPKATAPARSSYVSASGKSVNVRKDSTAVKTMRSRPSTDYTPAARTQRTEVHITNYGYSHPYSYYHSHSPYYMGGGYSSAYWWMMMEWDANRRARWLYHNQSNIESAAYQKGMQDAAVATEIARLKAEGTSADSNYIDKEFADNPDLMYDQEYVEAAYNPTVVQPRRSSAGTILLWIIIISMLLYGGYFVTCKMRWGK